MSGATALDPDELERLQAALVERMQDAGCMPLDVAHGFLTATAASGDADALLAEALGGLVDDAEAAGLLGRLRAQVLDDLARADYGPLIVQLPRDDGSLLPLPCGWCQGYARGLDHLGQHRRDRLLADAQAGTLLAPILSFLKYDEDQWFDPPNETAHRETVDQLAEAALGLHRWWRAQPDA